MFYFLSDMLKILALIVSRDRFLA